MRFGLDQILAAQKQNILKQSRETQETLVKTARDGQTVLTMQQQAL
jgi:hypothetical protein